MTHVVTEGCIKCKHQDCVDVCPVDCFHEGENFLAINPDDCIDCTVCIPVCPEKAIFADHSIPTDQEHFIELNAELVASWPLIYELSIEQQIYALAVLGDQADFQESNVLVDKTP